MGTERATDKAMMRLKQTTRVMACLAGVCCACSSGGETGGPLAEIAQDLLAHGLECAEVDHWPLPDVQPPFEECTGTVADTFLVVVTDASNTAALVVRKWGVVGDGEKEYADLLSTLEESYGDGIAVPPPLEDNVTRLMTLWSFQTHHLVLRYMPSESTMYWEWRLGPPEQ